MKNAISPEPHTVPSNIIFFPRPHVQSVGASGMPGVTDAPPAGTESGESSIRMMARFRSQSDDILELMAETREILTRYSGVGAAMAGFREKTLYVLPSVQSQDPSFKTGEATSNHHPMKISITQAELAELLALKRQEKPPENFFRDFIEEFHRRNDPPLAKSGPPATKRKVSHSS